MNLHSDNYGNGAPLVMLHGWGMHGGIWGNAVSMLAQHFRVHCVDLPGHGYSAPSERELNLDAIVDQLSLGFKEAVTVCGWSLGGLIALRWAQRQPQQVSRLVLVATTPCFVRRLGWDCAMPADVLQNFAASLQENYTLTLRRFVSLQMRGSEHERDLLADVRERLFSRGQPDALALAAGLDILRDTDLRADLPQIAQPTLVISGQRDTLTPPAASAWLAATLADARAMEIKGAAHMPFLSHPEIFVQYLTEFQHERI